MEHHYYFCKKSSFNSHAALDAASDRSRVKHGMTGFTLAEVLITLGIIGIVAVLTMPALIEKHQKQVTEVRLKKFYSQFLQALQMSEAEHGDIRFWPHNESGAYMSSENLPFYTEYLFKYMNTTKICDTFLGNKDKCAQSSSFVSDKMRIFLSDGSCFGMNNQNTNGSTNGSSISIQYDINCNKGPNKYGRDQFFFFSYFGEDERQLSLYYPLRPYNSVYNAQKHKQYSRDDLLNLCKTSKAECAAIIQYDGWKISPDYPW